jgi:hypothetical protein
MSSSERWFSLTAGNVPRVHEPQIREKPAEEEPLRLTTPVRMMAASHAPRNDRESRFVAWEAGRLR